MYVSYDGYDRSVSHSTEVRCARASPRPRLVEADSGRHLATCQPGCLNDCDCGHLHGCKNFQCAPKSCSLRDIHANVVSSSGLGPAAGHVLVYCHTGKVMRLPGGQVVSSVRAFCALPRDCSRSGAAAAAVFLTVGTNLTIPACQDGCISNEVSSLQ